jgi:hypothetical protein
MPVLSESNALWIEFYSDGSNEDQGFALKLESVFEGEFTTPYSQMLFFVVVQISSGMACEAWSVSSKIQHADNNL